MERPKKRPHLWCQGDGSPNTCTCGADNYNDGIQDCFDLCRQATKELLERIEDNILSGWPDDQQMPHDVHAHIGDIINAELAKLEEPNETQRPKEA